MKYILLSNKKLKDINPMECGEEYCPPNFKAGPTSRQYYLLHFVFSGRGRFCTGEDEYHISRGQIFIMHPFEVVTYFAEPSDPWHYCWVGFEMSFRSYFLEHKSVIEIPGTEHIFNAIKNTRQINSSREYYICGKIYEFLSLIEQDQTTEKSKSLEYVKKAKQYIDLNYLHQITIDQIAEELNINRSYFSTIFSKYMGISPQQYLIEVRLENAAALISDYGFSVGNAAISSGYSDIFNFSRMFKKKYGIPPAQYAKKTRSE